MEENVGGLIPKLVECADPTGFLGVFGRPDTTVLEAFAPFGGMKYSLLGAIPEKWAGISTEREVRWCLNMNVKGPE